MRVNLKQLASAGVFVIFGLLALGSDKLKGDGSSSSGSGDDKKAKEPDVRVTAAKLFDDYHANEVSADNKYKGKRIAVTGTVTEITKDFTDSIVINLGTANEFMPIMATVNDSEKGKAAELEKGTSITLFCDGKGMVIGHPSLDHCVFATAEEPAKPAKPSPSAKKSK